VVVGVGGDSAIAMDERRWPEVEGEEMEEEKGEERRKDDHEQPSTFYIGS
jgi:hypothetical protein